MRLSKPITYFPSFPAGKLTVMSTQNLNEKVSPDRTFQGLYLKDQDTYQDMSVKDKNTNQDQTVKDKEFTSALQVSFRTRTTNITGKNDPTLMRCGIVTKLNNVQNYECSLNI